jgi:hypothetical protein
MVPNVAANADPYTGYEAFVHGVMTTVGGTLDTAPRRKRSAAHS